ncbi:MAG: AMP-binding protein [Hyphomicrobiales bacterium]|nr:AMP-binding protein [Hyphomicrobiales bacterium]
MNDRPWLKSYPPGVRWDAPIELAPVQSILETAAERFGEKPALEFMGRRIGYAELDALASRAAAGFERLGIGPGVHVGLYLPNTPHYVIALFGALKAGATIVSYSPLDALRALSFKIEDSETEVLITLDAAALYPQAEKLLDSTRLKRLIVGAFAEFALAPEPVTAQMKAMGLIGEPRADERIVAFADLLDNDGRYEAHPLGDLSEALAAIQYTGGTTGSPKGAMLSHANLSAACAQYTEIRTASDFEVGAERVLCVLPLFHIFGLSAVLIASLRLGAEVILHARFDPAAVAKDIAEKKITYFPGVPTMHLALLRLPNIAAFDLSSLKRCVSGGAPLPITMQEQFQAATGRLLTEGGWGMTETSPAGTFKPYPGPAKLGSCGIPAPRVDIKFIDAARPWRDLAFGERGEICVKGPNVTQGYWKNPQATAAAMTADGFFRTGDVGAMDEDGFLYIVDRTKDMLLVGGFNVYPRNIEEAIYEHPAVEEVAVIGVPDAYRGETPKAFVKLKAGAPAPTLEEMKAFLRDKLGKHEMIGAMEIRDALPHTAVGKISKKDLRELEAAAHAG